MKRDFLKVFGTLLLTGSIMTSAFAQKPKASDKGKVDVTRQVIIQPKGDVNTKVVIEIKDGVVKVDGKPVSEFDNDKVSVRIVDNDMMGVRTIAPRSQFRKNINTTVWTDDNRAFLGVMSEDDENGAKVSSVTKGSAAEKAGLKEGDVITKVNSED